jgi:hypothetical protein
MEAAGSLRIHKLGLLSEEELALMIDVKPHTLAVWRSEGKGPDYTRLGKSVFYRETDVADWVAANVVVTKRTA